MFFKSSCKDKPLENMFWKQGMTGEEDKKKIKEYKYM